MNYLSDLFQNLKELTHYAPGADGGASLDDMQAAARSAHKRICTIITTGIYDAVVASDSQQLKDALRMAMANMTLYVQLTFDVINRRKNDVDVYKYELEGMKRAYVENYYNAMDSLVGLIAAMTEGEIAGLWEGSRYGKLIGACQVKTADDFDTIYPIDGSQLFFFRTLPIQKEIIDSRLAGYFEKASGDDRALGMLRLVLTKKVVAAALRRFDVLECPATIRNLFDDSTVSGQRKDEREQAQSLADMLDREADDLLETIDTMLSADSNLDVSSMSAFNREDDNIIMMP